MAYDSEVAQARKLAMSKEKTEVLRRRNAVRSSCDQDLRRTLLGVGLNLYLVEVAKATFQHML